jgi:hypothetical protein
MPSLEAVSLIDANHAASVSLTASAALELHDQLLDLDARGWRGGKVVANDMSDLPAAHSRSSRQLNGFE